jgi:hypothetical protein
MSPSGHRCVTNLSPCHLDGSLTAGIAVLLLVMHECVVRQHVCCGHGVPQ